MMREHGGLVGDYWTLGIRTSEAERSTSMSRLSSHEEEVLEQGTMSMKPKWVPVARVEQCNQDALQTIDVG